MDTRGHTATDPTSPEFPGYLFKALERTIGDESCVKIRRETSDMCSKILSRIKGRHVFYSGSFAEGFHLDTSDRDIMITDNSLILINDASEAKTVDGLKYLQMNRRQCRPGFTRLKILKVRSDSGATSDGFLRHSYVQTLGLFSDSLCQHGPSYQGTIHDLDVDFVFCIPCNTWTTEKTEFRTRSQQSNWPTPQIVGDIQSESHVVPVSSKYSEFEDSEWRISFSVAENKIIRTLNQTQFLCYGLLKLVLVHIINHNFPNMLCSYFMKTLMFWEIQESENKDWKEGDILQHFWKCLERLTRWVSEDNCPNFFIPENNMFSYRFTVTQQQELLQFLLYLDDRGNCIFHEIPDLHIASDITRSSRLHIYLELKKCVTEIEGTTGECRNDSPELLSLLRSLPQNESSPEYVFVKETTEECIIKHLLCKAMTQFLSRGEQGNRERYEYHTQVRCYTERLEEGSVTARLWAATARYSIGQYSTAIDILQYLKEVVRPMYDNDLNQLADVYQRKRMCLPIVLYRYFCVTELYPEFEAFEQNEFDCFIPPSVYADWLLFMCYHHSKDQRKRDAVLNDLHASSFDDCVSTYRPRDIILNMVGYVTHFPEITSKLGGCSENHKISVAHVPLWRFGGSNN